MIIRCWGARGSIPVSGGEYIKYGGDTTCLDIRTNDGRVIIIDAGSGIRKLGISLLEEKLSDYHLIFTHAHWDHILGFPFFRPIYSPKTTVQMYGCPFAQESVKKIISKTMEMPNFPVQYEDIGADVSYHLSCADGFSIGTVGIFPIQLSHPNRSVGYKFVEDGKSFVFFTDHEVSHSHEGGLDYDSYVEFAHGADLLIHDAEYTDDDYHKTKSWGHSTYKDALRLASDAGVKRLGLFHHNQDRTDDQIDGIVGECRSMIGKQGLEMDCFGVTQSMEFRL